MEAKAGIWGRILGALGHTSRFLLVYTKCVYAGKYPEHFPSKASGFPVDAEPAQ